MPGSPYFAPRWPTNSPCRRPLVLGLGNLAEDLLVFGPTNQEIDEAPALRVEPQSGEIGRLYQELRWRPSQSKQSISPGLIAVFWFLCVYPSGGRVFHCEELLERTKWARVALTASANCWRRSAVILSFSNSMAAVSFSQSWAGPL